MTKSLSDHGRRVQFLAYSPGVLFWKLPQTSPVCEPCYEGYLTFCICWVSDRNQAFPVNQTLGIHCKAGCDPSWWIWRSGGWHLRVVKRFEMYSWPWGRRSCLVMKPSKSESTFVPQSYTRSLKLIMFLLHILSPSLSLSLVCLMCLVPALFLLRWKWQDRICIRSYAVKPFLKLLRGAVSLANASMLNYKAACHSTSPSTISPVFKWLYFRRPFTAFELLQHISAP